MTVIQTNSFKYHESLHARDDGHADRWWKVVYKPKKDFRELCQRDGRCECVDSFDDVK